MQISKSFEELTALLVKFLGEACSLQNSSVAYSTLLAFRDIAALVIALSPVVHHRDFQVKIHYDPKIGASLSLKSHLQGGIA